MSSVIRIEQMGHSHTATIWSGTVSLLTEGQAAVGLVVLFCSVIAPLAKLGATKEGVLPISQQSIFVLSSLAYHAYEGVALLENTRFLPGDEENDRDLAAFWASLGDLFVNRMGFGAMRVTGPGIWGEPPDRDAARAAVDEARAPSPRRTTRASR